MVCGRVSAIEFRAPVENSPLAEPRGNVEQHDERFELIGQVDHAAL
jgi:hypothetical protein